MNSGGIKMKMPKSDSFIKFRTFRILDESKEVLSKVICAYEAKPSVDGGYPVSIAYCSPDDIYNRKKGRLKAVGRLMKGGETKRGIKRVLGIFPTDGDMKKALRDLVIADARDRGIKWFPEFKDASEEAIKERVV